MKKIQSKLRKIRGELQELICDLELIPERIKEAKAPDFKRVIDHINEADFHWESDDFKSSNTEIENAITACKDLLKEEGLTEPQEKVIEWIKSFPDDLDHNVEMIDEER